MAKDSGFDLAAMLADLKDVPESGTGREQIEYIDISLLDDDPNNFYELRDLDNLAANIATCGLQQPIRVRKNPEQDGRYIIVSGHRRRAALELLVKDDAVKWSEAPCIVERDDVSPELQELRLIYANAHTRHLTPAEISDQAVKVEQLLYKLEEQGYPFPGRMRDHVAKAVGTNKTKLSNLKKIRENLDQVWNPAFKKGQLSESVALALAQMPKSWQKALSLRYIECPKSLYADTVKSYQKCFERIQKIQCDLQRIPCTHDCVMRERLVSENRTWAPSCTGCCKKCPELRTCKYSCSFAASEKALAKDQFRTKKSNEKANELAMIEPMLQIGRGVYQRWYEALNANGLTIEGYLEQCGSRCYGNDAKTFQKYGEDPEKLQKTEVKLPFAQNLYVSDVKALVAAADVLGCSIDWLLGRDVPSPMEELAKAAVSGWQTGDPDESLAGDRFVVLTKWSTYGVVKPHVMEWSGDYWDYSGHNAVEAGAIIIGWMPMPEEV